MKPLTRKALFAGGGVFAAIGVLAVAAGIALGVHAATSPNGHGYGPFGSFGRVCGPDRIDRLASVGERLSDLSVAQQEARARFRAELDKSRNRLRQVCLDLKAEGRPQNLPERMNRLETVLAARLAALRTVKTSFGEFYEILDAGQREMFDELKLRKRFRRHHHHDGHHH